MAATLEDFAKRICEDRLGRDKFVKRFRKFLTKVDLPDDWKDSSGYELQDALPTYKHRYNCLRKFVEQAEEKSMTVDQLEDFVKKIEIAAHSPLETERSFSSIQEHRSQPFDLFEQNFKVKGVVVRKCENKLKASILTKKVKTKDGGKQKFLLNELVLHIRDASKSAGGFQLEVGDVVEVTKCRRKEGIALDAQLIKCFCHTESEMQEFLDYLVNCLQHEGTTAAITELTRCRASWDYILKNCNDKMAPQILDIMDKICSSAQKQMSDTVKEIVKGLERSMFFKSVLPCFIDSVTKENNNRVQRVLEHVLRVSPENGPKLLHMATDLAHNLVHNSSDEETASEDLHTGCHSAIEFLAKLSSIIAVEVPGARTDLTALQWQDLPLIPVTTELHEARLKTDDLPKIIPEGNYQSEEEYLDTHFRLLREECFYKLRKGISGFVTNSGKFDSKDMMMYSIVLLAVSTGGDEHSPTAMSIALKYTVLDSKPDADVGDLSSWFMYGDLLCISIDNSFQEPIWATVEKHVAKQRIVWIILCGGANVINEAQFIMKMQDVTDRNEQAFMAESQTFYAAYAPAMDVLKHKDCVPFKEFLVHPKTNAGSMKPADYINEIKQQPDWGIIFKREHLPDRSQHEDNESYSLLKEFDQLKNDHKCPAELDDTQLEAVELALKKKLALIQGPPGTGKSFVGVALVRLLLSMNVPQNHGPILVITYKNFALDHFLEDCLKKVSSHDVKIVRVGRLAQGASEELENCLLRTVGSYWPQQRFEQKRTLTGRLWAMQSLVREAIRKLRESSSFNAEIFLNEASRDQIKYLLVDNENETVDGANVERLLDAQDHGRLKKLVEKALKEWLPAPKKFDSFAREEKRPLEESGKAKLNTKDNADKSQKSSTGSKKERSKEDQDQENQNELRDPAMEQEERLLAVDEDLLDDEDKEIMEIKKKEDLVPQGREKTVDKAFTRKLICIDETEVKDFRNLLNASKVWELKEDERIQLVYVFQSSHRAKACAEFLAVSEEYMKIHQELEELKNQRNIEVMRTCDVIGMTVTGATIRANLLVDIKPSVMIVEEAAEILEGQLVAVIPPSVQHLIMIGDHKQLKPLVNFHRLKKHNLDLSMFERLVKCKLPYKQLEFQSRMRDELADLLRLLNIYKELKTNEKRVSRYEVPQCVKKSMYFWTHKELESDSKNSHSKLNEEEAIKITEVAETFCREGQVLPSRITVLCSYRGQVTAIKNRFLRSQVTELRDIPVSTIDSYQGQENDIILLSLVRSSKSGLIGHLSSPNRLCVAISRAHCGLYLFGNDGQLSKASKPWKKVTDAMRKKGCLGDTFPFRSSSQFKSQAKAEDQMEGLSPGKGPETLFVENLTVINAVNVIHAGDNSRNTITTTPADPADPASGRRLPPDLLRVPQSEKIPVHHPKSPAPPEGCPLPRMEGGSGSDDTNPDFVFVQVAETEGRGADVEHVVESTKDARMPIQESPKAVKSSPDSSETEKEEQRPVQESEDSKNNLTDATITDGEIMAGGKEARQPTQESPEAEKASADSSEIEKEEQRPVQESEDPKNRPTDTTITDEEIMEGGKEARQPTQESPEAEKASPDSSEIEKEEQRPVQESEDPKNRPTDTTITDEEIMEGGKETRQPTQESPEAEKASPDSSEIEKEEQRPVQESEDPKNRPTDTTITDEEIMEGGKEARQPTQESPEAEKASPDSSEIEKEEQRPVQESEDPKKSLTGTTITDEEIMEGDKEARQPTQETSDAERPSPDSTEIEKKEKRPVQESEDPKNSIKETNVEEEISTDDKEATQPTQAPSEANNLSVDVTELENLKKRPVQESESPKKIIPETTVMGEEKMAGDKEARRPTQATSEAEKLCTDAIDLENMKEKPVQESENPKSSTADTPTLEDEIMKEAPVQESEEPAVRKDELKDHPVKSVRQVFQEGDLKDSASSGAQTKSNKEEALPTQETMPAGKGPVEETGLEVGVKGQPTDEQE